MFYKKKKRFFKGKACRVNKKIVVHPHYIVGEEDNNYLSYGITHSSKSGKHKNHKLKKNPNKEDSRDAYVKPYLVKDKKSKYYSYFKNLKMSKCDEKYISYLVGKKIKK